jgi:hypothetical protein
MSIAELIMTGTQQASKSTDWVADSLAKIGDNVGKVLREREQQKQAQEMLPFLQQGIQESMTLAGQGKSGEAYSKMIGMLTPEVMNTPQSMTLVKLGIDAIGKSTDDFIMGQRATQNTGMTATDLIALRAMGITPPETNTPSTNVVPKTTPSGGANPALADFDTRVDEVNLPANPEKGQGDSGLTAPVGTRPQPSIVTKPPQAAPTPEQELAASFVQKNQNIAQTQGVGSAWYNEAVSKDSPKLKQLDQTHEPIDLKGANQFQFGTMYFPKEKDLDKEIKITGKGNDFNISMDLNKVDPKKEEERRDFKQNIINALGMMQSKEMQMLFKEYGSIENFPLPSMSNPKSIKFPIKDKEGKEKMISLPVTGNIKNMGLGDAFKLLQNAPGIGRPIGILIARSGMSTGGDRNSKENLANILK